MTADRCAEEIFEDERESATPSVDRRVPPHDIEAEAAILSAIMIDPAAMPKVQPILRPESFYGEAHRRIYEACEWLSGKGKPMDVVMVGTRLRDTGRLAQVGGPAYLTQVLNEAPAVARVESYAETVSKKARVRQLQVTCQRLVAESYAPIADEDAFIDEAERLVHAIGAARASRRKAETMRSVLQTVFSKLQDSFNRELKGYSGTPTNLHVLDEAMGGLHDGESVILAARPGMGKTALAMNIASSVAHRGLGVVVFSLEMPNEQIVTRALCAEARVDGRKARTNRFDRHDWSKITGALQRVSAPEHFYLEDASCGLLEIRSIARARQSDMARTGAKLGLIVVDYVQLMATRETKNSNREQHVAENARGLKMLAKELACPVLLLSQLNRGVEARNDKRPMLSDLRESGALEEAADCVIGMYRDDYYHEKSATPGIVELALLKHRHGPTGVVEVAFDAKVTRFDNKPEDMPASDWHDREAAQ